MVLKGKSQASLAPLVLLDQLADAITRVPAALEVLHAPGSDAQKSIDALHSSDPAIAQALDAYLDEYGLRLVTGFDVCELSLSELPHMLLKSIEAQIERRAGQLFTCQEQQAVAGKVQTPNDTDNVEQAARGLRDRVPVHARAEYDRLLEEASFCYGFEDEHVGIAFLWPAGLMRRALLVAGERLASRGIIQHAEHLLDATPDEVALLLDGRNGPPAGEELASRATTRHQLDLEEMPLQLGEAETPPPAGLLPAACTRAMQATLFFMAHSNFASSKQPVRTPVGAPLEEAQGRPTQTTEKRASLHGQGVSLGRYEGRACIVLAPADFEKIEAGDVLVTHTTSPAYNVLLPLLGAIVTDCGGVLCHAAIVAREFGIPGVVGTGDATSRIADGMRIIVNGERGTVEILS